MDSRASSSTIASARASRVTRAADRTLLMLALGALLFGTWHRVSQVHRRRRLDKSEPLPRQVQSWEGEGGRVNDDGAFVASVPLACIEAISKG